MKGAVIGVMGLGLALGAATQANAMPGYTKDQHPYDDTCKSCHATDPYAKTSAPADNNGSSTPADNSGSASTTPAATGEKATTALPQTGAEGIYLNYLAGAGLLIPGAALLASRKKQR